MKRLLMIIFILLLLFGGYVIYTKNFDTTNVNHKIVLQEEIIDIDEIYVYGTHLNLHGNIINTNDLDLVLYNNNSFTDIKINVNMDSLTFNLSDYVNDGLYLDNIPRGYYYIFMRQKETDKNGNVLFKYYALNNISNYKETTYYTFSNYNNKITIGSEEEYSTMYMNIEENKEENIYDVVIDPGHGGFDGGAERYGYKETDFTLKIAEGIKNKLEKSGLRVKLTHSTGELSSTDILEKYGTHGRAVISSEVKAKYIFSIHLNSNNYDYLNGLEVYTPGNINYDYAKLIRDNIINETGLKYSSNKTGKVYDSIYTRLNTDEDIKNLINDFKDDNLIPYDVPSKSNYYFIIRETGGIITGAYVDDRNKDKNPNYNPYVLSNVGTEAYLLELGYISNRDNLDKLINNLDSYINSISSSILTLYNK